jgi:hypothetical protein
VTKAPDIHLKAAAEAATQTKGTEEPVHVPASPLTSRFSFPPDVEVFLTEDDLTNRWPVSKKTLQRWRTLGAGVPHIKLGRRVAYRLQDVVDFECSSARISTSKRLMR